MRKRRVICELVIFIAFCYVGFICLKSSSLWHMYFDHHDLKAHHEMMVDFTCADGLVIQSNQRSCYRRLQQLRNNHADKCFAKYGLKGNVTDCELVKYMVKIEHNCMDVSEEVHSNVQTAPEIASKNEFFGPLYAQLGKCGSICSFLKSRIQNNEKIWARTYDHVFHHNEVEYTDDEGTVHHKKRHKRSIFIHLGLLKEERGLDFGHGALKGGPLGELNQWADLIAALWILGHHVTLSWSPETLASSVSTPSTPVSTCKVARPADIFYTDIHGVKELYKLAGNNISRLRCTLRILDSFGTEPAYNHESYVRAHQLKKGYGQFNINPQQYMTQWPHTPDNSFMGFVVHRMSAEEAEKVERNSTWALLYGKKEEIIHREEAKLILAALRDEFNIQATLFQKPGAEEAEISSVPSFINNHGYVNQSAFLSLMRQSKVYVGLGKPPEGPAALEAVANGAIFLQPRYEGGRDEYQNKPTERVLTSQNPFMETLGRGFSYTYDQYNETDIRNVLTEIKNSTIKQFVPYPFTHEGVLKRVHAYVEHQNFCEETDWPPKKSMKIKLGAPGESCNEVCEKHRDHGSGGDKCERSWFKHINSIETLLTRVPNCREKHKTSDKIVSPYFDHAHKSCYTQRDPLLFSCTGSLENAKRLCPCRDTSRQDPSLCSTCFVGEQTHQTNHDQPIHHDERDL